MIAMNEKTLRRVELYSERKGEKRDKVIENATNYYLDKKENN